MHFGRRAAGILASLVILGASAVAAEKPAPPKMTLPQLISLALKYSPQVKTIQSEVDIAKAQKAEVHGYRFPQFNITATGGPAPKARAPQIRGNEIVYPDTKNDLHGLTVFGRLDFSLIQPLYTFGKIAHREEAAEKYTRVKTAEVDSQIGEVILNVAQAYYGLILAQQGKDAVREARDYLNDARERVTRLLALKSPSVKDTDPYRIALYEGSLEKFAAEAEEGAKVAYKALKALIGYGPEQDFQVPLELPEPAPAPYELDYYIKQALELRPEFTMLKEGKAARELLVKAAKADFKPDLFLALIGILSGSPGRFSNPDPFHEDLTNWAAVGPVVGARWHFDFGITKAKLAQARAELAKLQQQERTALMGIPVEVAQAYGEVQKQYKAAQGMGKAYVNARRWLVAAFSNFDIGLGHMEEIFRAFERYGASRGDYLSALYEYNFAVVKLEKATGAYRLEKPERKSPQPGEREKEPPQGKKPSKVG
uniref:TolC family protein n=1 Tax=Desulfobacca acetoxidans TaxID=60893 RepID=A0A7C3YYD7_9BACT